ncbi:MAG: glycoside hydrolase family 1 protein, partial [Phenylobacterium sp.]
TDQIDWDTGLREANGRVHPVGLYDLNRDIRPVGRSYKQLIADWREVLPTQSVCLSVPIVPPSEHEGRVAARHQAEARQHRTVELTAGESG